MRKIAHITTALLIFATAQAACADVDAQTALKRMFEAEKKVCFIAHEVTTLARGPALTSEQTVYRAGVKGMRMEYTSPPALKGEVRADDGRVLAHYIPEQKLLRLRPSRIASTRSWIDHSDRMFGRGHVSLQLVGKDKIAGRSAYVIEIKPNDKHRPSRKIWIDTEKWIKLKTEEISPGGTVLSMSYFTKIDFVNSIPDEKFRINTPPGVEVERDDTGSSKEMTIEKAQAIAGFHVLKPSYLPQGFKPAGATVIPFRDGKMVGLRYTDGVSAVSLFQTPKTKLSPKFMERLRHGPSKSGTEVYTWQKGEMSLTVIGRLPMDQLRRIAQSVK